MYRRSMTAGTLLRPSADRPSPDDLILSLHANDSGDVSGTARRRAGRLGRAAGAARERSAGLQERAGPAGATAASCGGGRRAQDAGARRPRPVAIQPANLLEP